MYPVRPATQADLPQLAELFVQYLAFYHIERNKAEAQIFLQARMERGESVVLLAEDSGILTAFVQLYPSWSSTRMGRIWVLNDLYVHSIYRRLGLGRALVLAAQQHCRATDGIELTLETAVDNMQGNNLYRSMGFHVVEGVNFYRWNP